MDLSIGNHKLLLSITEVPQIQSIKFEMKKEKDNSFIS